MFYICFVPSLYTLTSQWQMHMSERLHSRMASQIQGQVYFYMKFLSQKLRSHKNCVNSI